MFRPLHALVYLKMDAVDDTTKAGIFLPNESTYKLTRGRVVAIGPEVDLVSIGDHVATSQYAGTELNTDDGEFLLVKQDDIIVVLED